MKYSTLVLSTLLSLFVSNAVLAAEIVSSDTNKVIIGVVSADNASTLDDLVAKLSEQADKKGATSFKVLSATGDNKLHGVAEIYK